MEDSFGVTWPTIASLLTVTFKFKIILAIHK